MPRVWKANNFYDFMADPVMAMYVIFRQRLPPHQAAALRAMWWRPVYMNTSGYRFGKSRTATYAQMLQCILISNWQEGILSHTLRGSQYLFREHIDHEYQTNPLFRAFVVKKPTHGSSEWRIEFTNGSSITAYPADVLNKGLRLESLSLNGATIDEATALMNPDIIWDVMMNRVTKPPPKTARLLGITNTLRILGAAKYTFQPIYKSKDGRGGLVQMILTRMLEYAEAGDFSEPPSHIFQSMNLRDHLHPDGACYCGALTEPSGVKDDGNTYVKCTDPGCGLERIAWQDFFKGVLFRLRDAETVMTAILYAMRWLGKWQAVAEDVYSGAAVENMRRPDCFVETKRVKGDDVSVYTAGVDIGTGSTSRSSVSAITVVKRTLPDPEYRIVYARKLRCTLSELSGAIYRVHENFNLSALLIDPGGGGVWLVDKDHLASNKQIITTATGRVEKDTIPLISADAPFTEKGARIVHLFTPTMKLLANVTGLMQYSDQLINWAHDTVTTLVSDAKILRPYQAVTASGNSNEGIRLICTDINEGAEGLPSISVVSDELGEPKLTSHGYFSFYPKPDLSYSLVYGVVAMYLLTHDQARELPEDDGAITVITSDLENLGRPVEGQEIAASQDKEPADEEDEGSIVVIS